MVLKAMANDRRHLAFCHDEFRGPRSDLCRSGGIGNNNKVQFSTSLSQSQGHSYSRISRAPEASAPQIFQAPPRNY
ncbi:hypothetical protein TNCV_2276651 [Trichonephila clavipes]|nr:hypothetical protein TNCV_2276651 [Trichonephila clavipes]